MARTLSKAIIATTIVGLLGATVFFWHSMREVYGTMSSYAVDNYHSQIHQSQELETLIRERRIDAALARVQSDRDLAVVQLGQMRPHIDSATWRMGRDQHILDKLDTAIEKEVEYRRLNGETSGKLSDQARNVIEAYDE